MEEKNENEEKYVNQVRSSAGTSLRTKLKPVPQLATHRSGIDQARCVPTVGIPTVYSRDVRAVLLAVEAVVVGFRGVPQCMGDHRGQRVGEGGD